MPDNAQAMRLVILTTDMRESVPGCTNPQPHIGIAPGALLQGFALLPEIEVHVVSCLKEPLRSPEKIAPNIFYHGVVVPRMGWLRTGYQGCIRAVRKKTREIQPDIVHGQGTERDCAISAVLSGFPNVLTVHGNMRLIARVLRAKFLSYHWLAARLESFVLPRTNGVVCITNYTRNAVKLLAKNTWVLPNAVDSSFFEINVAPVSGHTPVILCIGTIDRRKNQIAFIHALDSLANEQKFKVLFLGRPEPGVYGEEFLKLVQVRNWCEHVGVVGRDQMRKYFQSAALLVLPTLEDNCPLVVLEAMAAGVPVLASNVGGVPDLIQHEVNGLLCDPQRPETFRAAVCRFLEDPPFAGRLAAEAKRQAQARFHPLVIARRHVEIYREVIAGKQVKTKTA
jgi:glycosyltransferase involved in cell wall biosynthesis